MRVYSKMFIVRCRPCRASRPQVAVEGCCHGDLDKIYGTMQRLEQMSGQTIDLLICCGDFQARSVHLPMAAHVVSQGCSQRALVSERAAALQAVRNEDDLECLACPPKYRELKTFHRYYTGAAVAPYPTLFSAPCRAVQPRRRCREPAARVLAAPRSRRQP